MRTDPQPEPRSLDPHRGFNRHAGDQAVADVLAWCEVDANWNPLHDLDVVAGRVLRREQAESLTRRRAQTIYISFEGVAQRIDVDIDRLPRLHPAQLVFLEVGGNPDVVERHHCEQRFAWLNALSRLDAFLADHPSHRRSDFGVAVIEQGLIELSLRLLNFRFSRHD